MKNCSCRRISLIEPFADSVNAWQIAGVSASSSIAILGAGGLGLGLVACAIEKGCSNIDIADLSDNRLSAARSLGAATASKSLSGRYDVVFDTVGSDSTRALAMRLTTKAGRCIALGFASPEYIVNMSELIRHQKQLVGSFVYSREQFEAAVSLVAHCDSNWVENLRFDEVEPMLRRYLNNDFTAVKAVLRPFS